MEIEKIVQRQLDAYNKRDLDLFLSFYSPTVDIYNFLESKPYISGQAEMKKVYRDVFGSSPALNAKIEGRIVFDNKVIDHEQVTGRKGVDFLEVVVIYEIKNSLIDKVYFIRKK